MYDKKGSQIDIAVLDFSKAFDTVPHDGLLSKLNHYGIDKHIWQWISNFKKKRKQCVVVDGVPSGLVDVDSGVPQGTVLGPILFLLHINDLPSIVSSKVRLFADDCLIYRQIKSNNDQIELQRDLNLLESWGVKCIGVVANKQELERSKISVWCYFHIVSITIHLHNVNL